MSVSHPAPARGRELARLREIPGRRWLTIVKRTFVRARAENEVGDLAAALAYYAVQSLFPGLLVLVALFGLIGSAATVDRLIDALRDVAPADALSLIQSTLDAIVANKGGAAALLGVGLLGALWSASSGAGSLMRAVNRTYGITETRGFVRLRLLALLIVFVGLLTALLLVGLLIAGAPISSAIGDAVGMPTLVSTLWWVAQWPVLAAAILLLLGVVYTVGPNLPERERRFRWITPGAIFALVMWILVSVLFSLYIRYFGSYNKTYGALGGAITLLVWLYVSAYTLLIGAELNAEVRGELAGKRPA